MQKYDSSSDHLTTPINQTSEDKKQKSKKNSHELLSQKEKKHIQKYRALDEIGVRTVDALLNIEYERCTADEVKIAARSKDGKSKPVIPDSTVLSESEKADDI